MAGCLFNHGACGCVCLGEGECHDPDVTDWCAAERVGLGAIVQTTCKACVHGSVHKPLQVNVSVCELSSPVHGSFV